MILLKVRDRYLNMALLVDAQVVIKEGEAKAVTLKFAAPSPAGVVASDRSVEPYQFAVVGQDAATVADWLEDRAGGLRP
jgi:hypothetical protein